MKLAKIIDFFKSHIKINIYRVGDIILTTNNTNPKYDYGGTWELWGAGKVPVGIDTTDTDFDTVEKTGGEKTHTLTVNEIPSHDHIISHVAVGSNAPGYTAWEENIAGGSGNTFKASAKTNATGGGQAHNNLQPYITCYMWKKTA